MRLRVSPKVCKSLEWWMSPAMEKGSSFWEHPWLTLTMDASLFSWGTHLQSQVTQDCWSTTDLLNDKLARAVCGSLSITTFQTPTVGSPCVVVDRQCHLQSAREPPRGDAVQSTDEGGRGAGVVGRKTPPVTVSESHLRDCPTNTQADWLSRTTINHAEWQLHPHLFRQIMDRFGLPIMELFASPSNAHLPWFFTRFQTPGAEGADALRCLWPQGLLYAFPLTPLKPRVIRKVLETGAEILLIAPHWPRRSWFADLVNLSISLPWQIPPDRISLYQGAIVHPEPQWLQLAIWHLNRRPYRRTISLEV